MVVSTGQICRRRFLSARRRARPQGLSKLNIMHHPNLNNSSSRTTTTDEDELDKLLQGLDQLTETLPDLYQQHQPLPKQVSVSKVLSPQAKTPQAAPQQQQQLFSPHSNPSRQQIFRKTEIQQQQASRKETQHQPQNNSFNNKDMEISVQPYHTRTDSKPFSYFRTNNNVSRSTSRASSRETNGLGGGGQSSTGLESPNVLRKIMGNGESVSNSDSRPLSPSGKEFNCFSKQVLEGVYNNICCSDFWKQKKI